jgi:hypothetical protein
MVLAHGVVVNAIARIGLGAMLGLLALGCGSKDLELPACVKNLVATCATAGTCTSEGTDAGAVSELCFASGVRASFTGELAGDSAPKTVSVTKADDSPCYSFETSLLRGEELHYVWKDAAGQVVATGRNGFGGAQILCLDGSETKTCEAAHNGSSTGACCDLTDLGNATCVSPVSCTSGTCP